MKLYSALAALFVGLVISANWLASKYTVHVGFGYVAPAGVFAIGAVLVLRDWIQQLKGLLWTMPLVYTSGLISWLVGDLAGWTGLERVAVASVVAFSISETIEAVVFTPLRNRNLTAGVALSATAGNAIDSAIFIWIALPAFPAFLTFHTLFMGNFVGKMEMIAVGTVLTFFRRRLIPVQTAIA